MRRVILALLAAGFVFVAGANNAQAGFGFLFGGHGCGGCDSCCEPTCCEPTCGCEAACEPTCGCEAACEPTCGCETTCCEPACCEPSCGHGCGGLLKKLFGWMHRSHGCCESSCCEPACGCEASCGCGH